MSAEDTAATQPGRRRCPVCWTWFTPNSPSNPHPRRYCCGACRIEDSRRRREREQTQLLPDANSTPSEPPDTSKPNTATHLSPTAVLDERRHPMSPN
jgi:hypothetical protein